MTDYLKIAEEMGKLVTEKQEAYGDSFTKSAEVLNLLYPNGVNPEQYTDMLTMVRIIDKLFRLSNKKDAFGESPYKDICGYALLGIKKDIQKEHDEFMDADDVDEYLGLKAENSINIQK